MRLQKFGRALAALGIAVAAAIAGSDARAAEPIKIGLSMSLTGGLAAGGKSALLAMEIWAEDVNARGGLLGRPVQIIDYDDQSSSANVPGIYTKLLEVDHVDLVVSAYATNQIAPAMPIVMQKNMVFMALFGTGVNDKFHYDRYFQILPNGKETRFGPSLGFLETATTMQPKPKTIALVGADAEYAQTVLAGAREKVKELGFEIVYDKSYPPTTVDFVPIVRAIQAANPEVIYVASYPPDTVGMVRASHEVGLKARMFGGGMIGLAFAPIKQQLGPLLNGIVSYDVYVPEPTMKFPGVEAFIARYREKAPAAGVDPLGFYLPPFAYAEMQILGDAVTKTGGLDQGKLAEYIHRETHHTIVGDVKFAENGEWEKSRILFVQYQGIAGGGLDQFKEAGHQVILYPPEFKSGEFRYPYTEAQK
jgi:branched-chain amino acid transport system substrate-binding protein